MTPNERFFLGLKIAVLKTGHLPAHLLGGNLAVVGAAVKTVHLASSQPDFGFSVPPPPICIVIGLRYWLDWRFSFAACPWARRGMRSATRPYRCPPRPQAPGRRHAPHPSPLFLLPPFNWPHARGRDPRSATRPTQSAPAPPTQGSQDQKSSSLKRQYPERLLAFALAVGFADVGG